MHEDVDYEPLPLNEAPTDALIETAWSEGDLKWLLMPHQVPAYEKYRAWEKLNPETQPGRYPRIFVLDIGKRWGKTSKRIVVRMEDCIQAPRRIGRPGLYRYTTAFQKDIEEIVEELLPLLLESCPEHLRPEMKPAYRGRAAGLYFPNGSRIALAGLDKQPDALRGRGCDGDDLSEAAFIKQLRYVAKNVLYHQYQQRPWARMCMESSAPKETDGEYDTEFVEDAKSRDAYVYATIDDNTALSEGEKEEFIRAAGGRDDPECQREYFNIRSRELSRAIVPEWNDQTMVRSIPVPEHALTFVAIDPGSRDLCGILWGYVHYIEALLVIQRAWAERNASTADIAEVIRQTEEELWSDLSWYSTAQLELKPAPYLRTSDTNPRLLQDLSREHGIRVAPVKKSGGLGGLQTELREAGVNSYRTAVKRGQVVADPEAVEFIAHMNAGRWNDKRTDYERSERFGHFDLIDCGVIIHRTAGPLISRDPFPPDYHHAVEETPDDVRRVALGHAKRREREESSAAKVIEALYGGGKKKKRDPIRRSKRTWRSR